MKNSLDDVGIAKITNPYKDNERKEKFPKYVLGA